jgi:hypothetical protein
MRKDLGVSARYDQVAATYAAADDVTSPALEVLLERCGRICAFGAGGKARSPLLGGRSVLEKRVLVWSELASVRHRALAVCLW